MDNVDESCYFLDETSGVFRLNKNNQDVVISNSSDLLYLNEESGNLTHQELVEPEKLRNLTNVEQHHRHNRKGNAISWQQSIRKMANASGQSYFTRKGRVKAAKFVKGFCTNCRYRCSLRILPDVRQKFFDKFYALSTFEQKHQFLLRYTRTFNVTRPKENSTRQLTRYYFIGTGKYENGNEMMERVCKTTFLKTLDISDKSVRTAYRKLVTCASLADFRGFHVQNRSDVDNQKRVIVKQHIDSFPLVESHYCRANTDNKYLDAELSLPKMYELYVAFFENSGLNPSLKVTLRVYRTIFNEDFDIKFNQIKKDACDECVAFKNADSHTKTNLKVSHDEHLWLKNRARERKNEHKMAALKAPCISSCVYDYQKGIQLPKAEASSFYYKRKLIVHNFTIYNLSTKDAYNYVYDESLTGVGPNEVCSFLNHYMEQEIAKGVNQFRFLSDNCGGQNRNQFVFFFYALFSAKHSVDVTHSFLVKGHTQNEGDSVHSVIERSLKKRTLFTPCQIYESIKNARKRKPYHVIEVGVEDLYDFKVSIIDCYPVC